MTDIRQLLPTNIYRGLISANSPSAANPFATINDITGAVSGTLNYLPKFTPNGTTLGNSLIYDTGTSIGIGTITPNGYFQIGVGNPVYPAFINIVNNTTGADYINFTNNNSAGYSGFLFEEDSDNIFSLARYNSTRPLNLAGTSIPLANNSLFQAGTNASLAGLPITFWGIPIYNLAGTISTNYGSRQDTIGFRIGQIQNLHTTNTSSLAVAGLKTFASNALAITGGLQVNDFYTDGAGNLKIVF